MKTQDLNNPQNQNLNKAQALDSSTQSQGLRKIGNQDLNHLFLDGVRKIYKAENLIVESLSQLINASSLPELKEVLEFHLQESKSQITRVERIFALLGLIPAEEACQAMDGLIEEASRLIKDKPKSPLLDAAIISAAQKIEHYEIASYGTLKSFAKHLNLEGEIADLLQKSLDEESAADKKLTKIAEGSFFSTGVNQVAAEMATARK